MKTGKRRERGGWSWGAWRVLGVGLVGVLLLGGGLADAGATVVWQWYGGAEDEHFGWAVAGVGDVDGDGVPDVVVTAPAADPGGVGGAGSVYGYAGGDGRRLWQANGEAGEQLGYAVAGVGDVNGDGVPDVIAGAPFADPGRRVDAGRVYLLSGKDGTLLWRVDGEAAGDALGWTVSGVGDVNGDGVADVVVGAPGAGRVSVLSGRDGTVLWRVDGEFGGEALGHAVGGVGDVNGDGVPDVVVGAPFAGPGGISFAGSVYLFSGLDGRRLWRADGGQFDELGTAVAGAGDIDGDGIPDVIASATFVGYIVVLSGVDGTVLRRIEWSNGDMEQFPVAGVGDVDGDGVPDILGGLDFASPGGRGIAGSAIVWSGADGRLLWRVDGQQVGDQLGYAVAGVGDVDGDGRADLVVGAPYASRPGHLGEAYLVRFTGEPSPAGVPEISLDRDRIDFGTARVGWSSRGSGFVIRNDGGVPLTITALGPATPPFYAYFAQPNLILPVTVAPGRMELVDVYFAPKARGRYRQMLQVLSDDPDEPVVTVLLQGQGVGGRR